MDTLKNLGGLLLKFFLRLLRYLVFIPIVFFAIGVVNWAFSHLLSLLFTLDLFWVIVCVLFLGSFIWSVFKLLSSLLIISVGPISPNKKFSFWTILILSIAYGVLTIYTSWTMDIDYTGKIIFIVIIFNILVIELTWSLIAGALYQINNK
jgi:hypothetical protein